MAEPAWDDLIEQLHDPNAKARRKAIRRLAAGGDPSAIPLLRNSYLQDDDDRVRLAAEKALHQFRARQEGLGRAQRSLPPDHALGRLVTALAVLLVGLLAANIGVRALSRANGESGASADRLVPAVERSVLERDLRTRLAQMREAMASLRERDRLYRESGALACEEAGRLLPPLELSEATRQAYQADLTRVAAALDAALPPLHSAQARWDAMCAAGIANMADIVRASAELDQVAVDLALAESDLLAAIANPAPTFGPSPTPTLAPSATLAAVPGSGNPQAQNPPPTAASTATETPIPSPTPLPSMTPSPTPTATPTPLPLPRLEYPAVLRQMSQRLAVIGDLRRPYRNGMLDNWERSQQGEPISALSCTLDPWPGAYEWSPEERAQLDQPATADPELEEALRLINQGLALAAEARALYEPSCRAQTLADTVDEGLPLAIRAYEILTEAQELVERIRRRPS